MRLIVVGWTDADWDEATEHRMVKEVLDTLRTELPRGTVSPNSAELLPTFTAAEIGQALGITEDTEPIHHEPSPQDLIAWPEDTG